MSSFTGSSGGLTPKKKQVKTKKFKIAAERPYLKLVHCVRVPAASTAVR
jgi:hypothetical protein